jgi:type II secretion system protein I
LRNGLTLYEIVLSIAIFTMAMAAISQLITIGSRASIQAQLQTEAAIRAENKMAEIVSGYQPLAAVAGEADPENNRWLWSLDVVDAPNATGLKELTVTVTHLSQVGVADASYSIKRLMRDPQLYFDAALAEEEAAAQATNQSSGGSTGGTGSSTQGTGSSKSSSNSGSSGGSAAGKASGGSTGSAPQTGGGSGAATPSSGGGMSSGGSSGTTSSKGKSR